MNYSLEMISYQNNDTFPQELESIIDSMVTDVDNKIYRNNKDLLTKSISRSDIERLIQKRFNMKVLIEPSLSAIAPVAIFPFFSDYLVTLIKRMLKY